MCVCLNFHFKGGVNNPMKLRDFIMKLIEFNFNDFMYVLIRFRYE